jgi:hypothetical protein
LDNPEQSHHPSHRPSDTDQSAIEKEETGDDAPVQVSLTVCVCSNDAVWAELLVQNLNARGVHTVQCDVRNLELRVRELGEGSWVVVDGGWPMHELRESIAFLNPLLRNSSASSVVVVDELVGSHPLTGFKPDLFLRRTPDMRVFVRSLLSAFEQRMPGNVLPA